MRMPVSPPQVLQIAEHMKDVDRKRARSRISSCCLFIALGLNQGLVRASTEQPNSNTCSHSLFIALATCQSDRA